MSKRTCEDRIGRDEEPPNKIARTQAYDRKTLWLRFAKKQKPLTWSVLPAELKHMIFEELVESNPDYLRDVANLRLVSKNWGQGFDRYLYHKLYFRLTSESISEVIRISKNPQMAATVQYLVMEAMVFRFLEEAESEGLSAKEREMYDDWRIAEPDVSILNLRDLDDYHNAGLSEARGTGDGYYRGILQMRKDEYHRQLLCDLRDAIPRFKNLKGIEMAPGFRDHRPDSMIQSPQDLTSSLREAAATAAGDSRTYAEYMWKSGLAKHFVDFDVEPMVFHGEADNHRRLLFWLLHIAHETTRPNTFSKFTLRPLGRDPQIGFLNPGRAYPTLPGVRTLRLQYHHWGRPLSRKDFIRLFRKFPGVENLELSGYAANRNGLFDIRQMMQYTMGIRSGFPALKSITLSNVLLDFDTLDALLYPEVELKLHNIHYALKEGEIQEFEGLEDLEHINVEFSGIHKASCVYKSEEYLHLHPYGAVILDTKDSRVGDAERFYETMYQKSRLPFHENSACAEPPSCARCPFHENSADRIREDDFIFGSGFVDYLDPTKFRDYLTRGKQLKGGNPFGYGDRAVDYRRYMRQGRLGPERNSGQGVDKSAYWRRLAELPEHRYRPLVIHHIGRMAFEPWGRTSFLKER